MQTKLNIIFSNYDDVQNPYYGGGGAIAIHEVAKRLASEFNVIVITGKYPGSGNVKIDNINYERTGLSYLNGRISQLVYQAYLPYLVLTKKYDLWFESFTPPFSTSFLPLFTKKPIIGVAHMLSGEDMRRKYKLPFHLIEAIGLRFYKNIIVVASDTKNKILKLNPGVNIKVIPNGVESVHPHNSRNNKKHILFMGRLEIDQKGLDLLLEAYSKISNRCYYSLCIAGPGTAQQIKWLKKRIGVLGLSRKVKITGRLDGYKKEKAYKHAILVVIPSRFETFSMVALEALSYGLPVVGFEIEGLSWLPRNCSIKGKPFDTSSLSEAMLKLCDDKKLNQVMGARGISYAKEYVWDNIAKKYSSVIKSVGREVSHE